MLSEDPLARRRLAYTVACLMLFFGVLFVYVTPPYQGPDETAHFHRVAMIVGGDLLPGTRDGKTAAELPKSLLRFAERHADLQSNLKAKYDYRRMVREIGMGASSRPRASTGFPTQATSPLMYAPALAGVAAGTLLSAISFTDQDPGNWATMQYFARLGNLFAVTLAVALALLYLPRFHAAVTFVALMPMTMFLSSSVQYDSMSVIACLGLFVVVVRRTVFRGDFTRRELALLAVSAFLLGHGKIVYLPLLLAIVPAALAVPWRRGIAAVGLAVGAALLGRAGSLVFTPVSGMPGDLVARQLEFLLNDLAGIPGLIWRTLAEMHGFYFRTLFGRFGWLDTAVPPSLLILVWAMFLLALFNDSRGPVRPVGAWTRLAILGGLLISLVGILLSLYVLWTPSETGAIGTPVVIGVQGRYFIPFLPFVAMMLSFNLRRFAWRVAGAIPDLMPLQLTLQAATLAVSLFVLLSRFWLGAGPP